MPITNKIDSASGAKRTLARLSDVLGAAPEVVQPQTLTDYLHKIKLSARPDVDDGLGTVAGLAAGAIYFGKHRVLGGIAGASLGRNVPALLKADQRRLALCNMATTGMGIAGARMLPKNSIFGFALGWVLGNVVTNRWR